VGCFCLYGVLRELKVDEIWKKWHEDEEAVQSFQQSEFEPDTADEEKKFEKNFVYHNFF